MTRFWLIFVASAAWISLILALIFGALAPWISGSSLVLAFFIAMAARTLPEKQVPWLWQEKAVAGGLGIFIYFQYLGLITVSGASVGVGNQNNLGDLPLHLNMIKAFARGLHFWPQNLEWAGEKLRYPFAINLWNALWESLGVRTSAHLFLTGMISSFLLLTELRKWGGVFLMLFFFGVSGAAFSQTSVELKNLFLAVFVTQRGFLWALPAGLYLLRLEREIHQGQQKDQLIFGFLWGSLSFFHLHSFAILSLYFGLVWWSDRSWSKIFRILIPVGFLGGAWTLFQIWGGENLKNSLGWSWAWTWNPVGQQSLWSYLLLNWICFFPILAFCLFRGLQKRSLRMLIPALLFLFFFNFKVAPWAWDNIKVLLWLMLILATHFSQDLFQKKWVSAQVVLGVLLFLPGFGQLWRSLPSITRVANFESARFVLECDLPNFDVNEALVFSPDYAHPLLFWGAKSFYGYEGHLWSHGYNLDQRKPWVATLLSSEILYGNDWRLAAKNLSAKWIYWSESEKRHSKDSASEMRFQNLKRKPACISKPRQGGQIYDLDSFSPR